MDDIIEQPDGSALIPEEVIVDVPESGHFDNLVEQIDTFEVNELSSDLLELVEKDKNARENRDKQQEEGIRRTGLGDDAPGGATFDGASKVVHPVLAEGCVDFSARAMKEIFPAKGPVKTKIYGKHDSKKLDKARRKRDFLNWQLTKQIKEYRAEKEILLTQLPLGGSQYEKYWYDPTLGRIRMEFVPIDEVFLPFAASSFYTSPRVTHMQTLTRHVFEERVRSGFYADVDNLIDEAEAEETASRKATDKIEGRSASGYNEDGVRIVYEISCYRELKVDGQGPKPYIIHVDESTARVLAVYRNWNENDPKYEKLGWWVENKFIPWRGAYGIGLLHLIGSLAGSATGALRALLDSAHINNAPTAVKLKGGRASGQNTTVDVTAVQEIEAPAGVDDIRKVMMPMPFNPPSNVLFQLLDWITQQAKGVVATAEEKIADVSSQMPVGTALALIEQGSQVFSSIHSRLHAAQAEALSIICRLNFQYPNQEDLARFGLVAEDFKDNDDVEPVSDPNIFSEAQRYAQFQAVMQMAQDPGVQYNKTELHRWGLELLRVDISDQILPKPPEPFTGDPISENQKALLGNPLKATPEQDHIAHIQEHIRVLLDPMLGAGPLFPGPLLQNILANITQHVVYLYHASAMTGAMLQAQMVGGGEMTAAQGAANAMGFIQQQFPQLAQQLQQAAQIVQSKMPQPPMDPAVKATFDAAMAETNRRAQRDQAELQMEQQRLALEPQMAQMQEQTKQMIAAQKEESARSIAILQAQAEKDRQDLMAQVELLKNKQDNEQHQHTELVKNLQDNYTQLQIALKQHAEQVQQLSEKQPDLPDFNPQVEQLNKMLSMVEQSKSSDALLAVGQGIQALMAQMTRPKRIVEDANGKPIGIE